jgi:hypothetical protein
LGEGGTQEPVAATTAADRSLVSHNTLGCYTITIFYSYISKGCMPECGLEIRGGINQALSLLDIQLTKNETS